MFSIVSVCLFTGGAHVTIVHDALDLTKQNVKFWNVANLKVHSRFRRLLF